MSAIQTEAIAGCEFGSWACLVHIMALSSVICRYIFTVYPDCTKAIRPLLHGLITPRTNILEKLHHPKPFYIWWARDSNLDSHANAMYVPNHFVPLFAKELGNSGLDSVKSKQNHPNPTTLGPLKKVPPSTSHKGKQSFSLQDFGFPSPPRQANE